MSSANHNPRPSTRSQMRLDALSAQIFANKVETSAIVDPASDAGMIEPRRPRKSTKSKQTAARRGATRSSGTATRSVHAQASVAAASGINADVSPALPVDRPTSSELEPTPGDITTSSRDEAGTSSAHFTRKQPNIEFAAFGSASSSTPSSLDAYQFRNPRDPLSYAQSSLKSPRADKLRRFALDNFRATTPINTGPESDLFPATPPPTTRSATDAHERNKQVNSTPHGDTARTGNRDSDGAEDIEAQLLKEVGSIYVTDNDYVKTLYRKLATAKEINEFIDSADSPFKRTEPKSPKGRWVGIPEVAERESHLYKPLAQAIEAVRKAFHSKIAAVPGVSRQVIDTHDANFYHLNHLVTRPDIVVRAEGPSFELPSKSSQSFQGMKALGYTNVAAVFELKREQSKGTDDENVGQLGRYCQQILMQQGNRKFTRGLLITEQTVRLVHFDRTGTFVTPFFNYHDDAHTFIRLILGLTSTKEEVLGLDTSIQWKIVQGTKTSGTINVSKPPVKKSAKPVKPTEYKLKNVHPVFSRSSICGRATTCWLATGPDSKDVIIKDAWHTGTRIAEHEYLERAREIPRVGRMICYETHLGETDDYRPAKYLDGLVAHNRKKLRIVMEAHGENISKFRTRYELIAALRDAVRAHRDLYSADILHRDISSYNILLGDTDDINAEDPIYGVLIDLDMAIFHSCPRDDVCGQIVTGTRRYQSVAVLRSYRIPAGEPIPPHDYLDDLESFFYVLCELMFTRVSPGKDVDEEARLLLERWEARDERLAVESKSAFITDILDRDWVDTDFWGPVCLMVLEGFHGFIYGIFREKSKIRNSRVSMQEKVALYKGLGLNGKIETHYKMLEDLFNTALVALELEEPETAPISRTVDALSGSSSVQETAASSVGSGTESTQLTANGRGTLKRDSSAVEDNEVAEHPAKRRSKRLINRTVKSTAT